MSQVQIAKKVLSINGYGLDKKTLSFREQQKIRKDLLVSPHIARGFGGKARSWPIYRESVKRLYIPRHYGLEHFGDIDEKRISMGEEINLEFKGTLRPIQKKATKAFLKTVGPTEKSFPSVKFPHGGILSLCCGQGKTICALYLIAKLKVKSLIVVHKEFLVHQWFDRIKEFLPGAKVGLIQQKKVDVEGKDIVIAMLQSLSMRDYGNEVFKRFGILIVDECHRISSEIFSRSLPKVGIRITCGLSATPTRADGLTKVFKWYLGKIIFKTKRKKDITISKTVHCLKIDAEKYSYGKPVVMRWNGNLNSAKMMNNIAEYFDRTKFISTLARKIIEKNPSRQILILSSRRKHLDEIKDLINCSTEEISVGYYVGGMNQDALKKSENCSIIVATYSMASEGLDIKGLNTLILATPMSNVTQSVGRILRKIDKKVPPMIIDVVDKFSSYTRQFEKRKKTYKREGFDKIYEKKITDWNTDKILEEKNTTKIKKSPPTTISRSVLFESD
jgi:superfamily II DNA or RNA helicase